jgi:hypothetical protein
MGEETVSVHGKIIIPIGSSFHDPERSGTKCHDIRSLHWIHIFSSWSP